VTGVELYRVSDAARLSSLGARLPPIPLDDGSVLLESPEKNAVLVSPDLRVADVPVRASDGPISGSRIVGRRDGALRVLAIATGDVLATLEDSADDYRPLSFSPDGDLLAGTNAARGDVHIWDAKTGALRAPPCAPPAP
jgi:WD40 repeat protein